MDVRCQIYPSMSFEMGISAAEVHLASFLHAYVHGNPADQRLNRTKKNNQHEHKLIQKKIKWSESDSILKETRMPWTTRKTRLRKFDHAEEKKTRMQKNVETS